MVNQQTRVRHMVNFPFSTDVVVDLVRSTSLFRGDDLLLMSINSNFNGSRPNV